MQKALQGNGGLASWQLFLLATAQIVDERSFSNAWVSLAPVFSGAKLTAEKLGLPHLQSAAEPLKRAHCTPIPRPYIQVVQDHLLDASKRAVDLLITLANFREPLECKCV